ncbi:MAG: amidase [Chlamydiales bacterium]
MSQNKATAQIINSTGVQIKNAIIEGKISAKDVVDEMKEKREDTNPTINAWISHDDDLAYQQAEKIDEWVKKGDVDRFPLLGIPIAIGERIKVKGLSDTLGSTLWDERVAQEDANEIERLKTAGAIIIGKTSCSEFCLTPSNTNDVIGSTLNPSNTEISLGGAEAGAAAAVASHMSPIALAIDGVGSLRLPCSDCGVLGFKPTRGIIPIVRSRHVPFSHRFFSQIGPITRNIDDMLLTLDVLSQYDCRDPFCVGHESRLNTEIQQGSSSTLSIGWSIDLGFAKVSDLAKERFFSLLSEIKMQGYPLKQSGIFIDHTILNHFANIHYVDNFTAILTALEESKGKRERLSETTNEWIEKGKHIKGTEYSIALSHFNWLEMVIDQYFESVDLLLLPPTILCPDERNQENEEFLSHFDLWSLLLPFNLTGHPSLCFTLGHTPEGIPISIQCVGKKFQDRALLEFAHLLQKNILKMTG